MPLYTPAVIEPAAGGRGPLDVRPAARPTKPAGRAVAKPGTSRGPLMIQPPNLSDYYPRRARLREITGKSTIRLTIDARGKVTLAEVLASTPEGVFETAARRVGRSLHFQPALRNNRPVAATVLLNLLWRLE